MKTKIKFLSIVLVAGLTLYSCSKEEQEACEEEGSDCIYRFLPIVQDPSANIEQGIDSTKTITVQDTMD
ncbi:hypothetical protein [Maribacter cobaltidurans]|nr:hypothetical protein [Maribacter cobaltidurans]